jgi:hypothetical protein
VVPAAVILGAVLAFPCPARADSGDSLARFLDGSALDDPGALPLTVNALIATAQDAITEDEYNRLTGVRKRVGFTLFGGFGLMGGSNAGRLRVNYSDTFTTSAEYADLFDIEGYSGGAEVSLIVTPFYSVHFGGGVLHHKGGPYKGNDFTDLLRFPFYLGLRLNAPLALSFDRWLDFQNPEYVTGLIPFAKVKLTGVWWNRVEISGSALPSYESSRDYFVQGLYPEIYGGGGVEFRIEAIAVWAEVGMAYQLFSPRLSKYFENDPTSEDPIVPGVPFEFSFTAGLTYYFGSGRIFHVQSG